MPRSIDTSKRKIQRTSRHVDNFGRTVVASLAEDYSGAGKTVRVRLGKTSSSPTVLAKILSNSGLTGPFPEGTPINVRVKRGHLDVLGVGLATQHVIRCLLEKVTDQSISAAVDSPEIVTFSAGNVLQDDDGMFSDTDNQIVISTPGMYQIQGSGVFASSSTGQRKLSIRLNGTGKWNNLWAPGATSGAGATIFVEYPLSEDDYIELWAGSSTTLNLTQSMLGVKLVD